MVVASVAVAALPLGARVEIEEFLWERAIVDGAEHDFTWLRKGASASPTNNSLAKGP